MTERHGLYTRLAKRFQEGGEWQKYYPVYEMVDTFIYWTDKVTQRAPYIRDTLDIKRVMSYVVLATVPCIFMSWFNTGYQINLALAETGVQAFSGWQASLTAVLGIPHDATNVFACLWLGLLYFLPIYVVTIIAGGAWEVLFAVVRKHEINEGFLVTSILYTLCLPPDIPLWLVALGISFGVVIGKEIFGGTGKNFLNPALTGRAFLYFAYPVFMSGDKAWVAVDGYSSATPLGVAALSGMAGISEAGYGWGQAFWGLIPGSLGETSAFACLLGGIFLVYTRIASWRTISGVMLGMIMTAWLLNAVGSETNPMFAMPWHWHLVLGGFAFGMIYMATEPVSGPGTDAGRWIYGFLIGFMTVLIRVVNPAFPEGVMLAILFSNLFAPLIDYFVVQFNTRKRMKFYSDIS